jgi:hypothetical protein
LRSCRMATTAWPSSACRRMAPSTCPGARDQGSP